jgi:hypothetical protein
MGLEVLSRRFALERLPRAPVAVNTDEVNAALLGTEAK